MRLVKKFSAAVAAALAVTVFGGTACFAQTNIDIENTYVEGDLYIYVYDGMYVPCDNNILIQNSYIGGDLVIYQYDGNGAFVPINSSFRGKTPAIY